MSAEVIHFPTPINTTDVVGSLRFLADWIEENPDQAHQVVVITRSEDSEELPVTYTYGHVADEANALYLIELAKHAMLHYDTKVVT